MDSTITEFIPWIANPSGESAQTGSPWDYTSYDYCDYWGGWTVWQYSWNGSVSGIAQVVDLDAFNGSLASLVATLVIGSPPVITNQPVSLVLTQGNTASFSVVAGPSPLTYRWHKSGNNMSNGGNVSGVYTANLTLSNVTTNDTANYNVVVSNGAGAVTSATATLTVFAPPYIITQPQSQFTATEQNATFAVAAGGTEPLVYRWQWNSTLYPPGTNTFTGFKAGNYSCIVSNAAGAVTSDVAALTIVSKPEISTPPQSQTNLAGVCCAFSVAATSAAPLTYQWQYNTTTYPPGASTFVACKAGSYSVVVSNVAGAVTSAVATLVFTNPPPAQPGHFDRISLLANGAVQLSMSGTACTNYVLECTSDLLGWTNLATLSGSNGLFQYTEPWVPNPGQRFYRIKLGP
jgi:hypothetical protein